MSERKIDEATMDNVEILAKLALTPQERQKSHGRDGKNPDLCGKVK